MNERSFQLLRTNPALTTNLQLVVSSDYKLYLETINSNKELNSDKYKHYIIGKDSLLEDVIPNFYKKIPVNLAFDVKNEDDTDIMYDNFDNQFDTTYFAGGQNIIDQWHSEEFEYFAPLYIKKDKLPKGFIILRVDEPAIYEINQSQYEITSLTKDNFKQEIVDKWKCVDVKNLSDSSELGVFLKNNFTENDKFPKAPFELDIKKNNFSRWYGMDYRTGVYAEKSMILNDKLFYQTPDFKLEEFITSGFRDNKIIYPNILNLKFLFDDTPADANQVKTWSMNRYYGFYVDDMVEVENLTTYKTPIIRTDVEIKNNIFVFEGTNESKNPFYQAWNENEKSFVYIDNNLHEVKRVVENNLYVYKIISDKKLDGKLDQIEINNKRVKINYNKSDGKNYITSIEGELIIDKYKDKDGFERSMLSDLYLIEIDGKYHVLKNDETENVDLSGNTVGYENNYYIQSDYVINSTESEGLEYWKGGKNSDFYTKKKIFNEKLEETPKQYQVYKIKFSDIKDFDYDRVHTNFSDFDYEKTHYHETPEMKLYAIEYRDQSIPKNFKKHEEGIDGQYKPQIVSSEYLSTDELFEVKNNDLTDIWRKNQIACKWGYMDSISHSDYSYKFNNHLSTGEIFNRTVNPFKKKPDLSNKNLDYFYRIGNFHDGTNNIYYYKQSTNITTDLLDQSHSSKFNLQKYIESEVDYFEYFFNNKQLFYNDGRFYERKYKKYSLFNSGDNFQNSSTLFKGLKVNIHGIDNFTLVNEDYNKIQKIIADEEKTFNGYKFTIILNDYYERYDGGYFVDSESNGVKDDLGLIDTSKNGIHLFLNEKYKNVLVLINIKIPILDTIYDLNNVEKVGENYGLYRAKTLDDTRIDDGIGEKYDPSIFIANNFIEAVNNMNDKNTFDEYINFYYIDEFGISGHTKITDYDNSTMSNIESWGKKVPPFILNFDYPNKLSMKKESYFYTPLIGPEYNIYDKFKTSASDKVSRKKDINDFLAREIQINEREIKRTSQAHKETIDYTDEIFRYSGSHDVIYKNIELFNTYDFWEISGETYVLDKNNVFYTNYNKFGKIDEVIFSKVNRRENILKLKNAENDKSIYPMVDEFGYSYIDRDIFKSNWDDDFYIETTMDIDEDSDITAGFVVSELIVTLSLDTSSLPTVVATATYTNNSSVPRDGDVKWEYMSPNDTNWSLSGTTTGVSIDILSEEVLTFNFNIDDTITGTHKFKTYITQSENATQSFNVTPTTAPTADFEPDSTQNIDVNDTITFQITGDISLVEEINWTFQGGTPQTSTDATVTVQYQDASNSPYDVTLEVSNSFGSDTKTVNDMVEVNPSEDAPVASFYGERAEDGYTSPSDTNVLLVISPPYNVANFYYDGTGGTPTSYQWSFNNGSPSQSTDANPTGITYTTTGQHTVTLTVSNAGGSDNISRTGYVSVIEPPEDEPLTL